MRKLKLSKNFPNRAKKICKFDDIEASKYLKEKIWKFSK
ncbi:hypothetical protein CAMRE0001_2701 [Campylobacter rectus RM3267]|uniref:Uncharacterized protein n=1 Tax=Campylobacter rectus RM3267 TaxID=553218 RepID=B9D406_CAMRE|nr:hypothetical protein CAMRE0001_2701 [Campylobacter rectus RM3267]